MGRPKHYYEPGMIYLITTVTYRREPVFADPAYARLAHDDIAFYAAKFQAKSLAHVVMPDHIHWIIFPSSEDYERFALEQQAGPRAKAPHEYYLGKILQDYKRHVAHAVNGHRRTHGAKVWQDGFRDDALRDEAALQAAIQYVLHNPVQAGLAEQPEDYPYLGVNLSWE